MDGIPSIILEVVDRARVLVNLRASQMTVAPRTSLHDTVALLTRHYETRRQEGVEMAICDRCLAMGPEELDACPFCGEPNEAPGSNEAPEAGGGHLEVDLKPTAEASEPETPEATAMPPIHPCARLFEPLADDDFADLVASMQKSGFDPAHPVVMLDGQIVDGVNRYRAALVAGVAPLVRVFEGGNPWELSWRENATRRHLVAGQRAALFLKYRAGSEAWDVATKTAPEAPVSVDTGPARTRERLAKDAGVSSATMARSLDLQRKDPERFEQIASGEKPKKHTPKPMPAPVATSDEKLTPSQRAERLASYTVEAAAPFAKQLCEILKPIAGAGRLGTARTAHANLRRGSELVKLHDTLARVLALECPKALAIPMTKLRASKKTTAKKGRRRG